MSILTQDTEETSGESTKVNVREPLARAFKIATENAEIGQSSGSGDRKLARTFLLIDLGAAMGYLLGDRGATSDGVESVAEMVPESVAESAPDSGTEIQIEQESDSGGRGTLSRLFLLGTVVGLGYVLRRRMGSMDRVVDEATDRARTVTDEAAMRMGETAGRTEAVTQQAADRIEETGEMAGEQIQEGSEMAAERVEESGEQTADQIEEAGETVEETEQEMEERAEEMTDSDDGEEE